MSKPTLFDRIKKAIENEVDAERRKTGETNYEDLACEAIDAACSYLADVGAVDECWAIRRTLKKEMGY